MKIYSSEELNTLDFQGKTMNFVQALLSVVCALLVMIIVMVVILI